MKLILIMLAALNLAALLFNIITSNHFDYTVGALNIFAAAVCLVIANLKYDYKIPVMYDSNGVKLKAGQVAMCLPGTIAKEPYEVEIFENQDNLYFKDRKAKTPYLCTRLTSGEGHSAVLWPYWCKRLTVKS